ncbi:MAG: hypothetical protein DLM57_12940 [Pseudonocardiales bacterium]|nr:MAG: hypothetical protein DLM57_12940 [Pseudonocardiales bacterium]
MNTHRAASILDIIAATLRQVSGCQRRPFGLRAVFLAAGLGSPVVAAVLGIVLRAHADDLSDVPSPEAVGPDEPGGGVRLLPPEQVSETVKSH